MFEKYLFAFCMLIGVQSNAFAQELTPDPGVSAGGETAKYCDPNVKPLLVSGDVLTLTDGYVPNTLVPDYVYHIKYNGTVTLSVYSLTPATVKWEKQTVKGGAWQYVDELPSTEPLEVTNVTNDVMYRATFNDGTPGPRGNQDQRALLATGILKPDIEKACSKEAVELDLNGGEFAYRSEWQLGYGSDPTVKVKEYADGTSKYTINASDKPLKGYVVLKYDHYNCSRSATSPRFRTDNFNVDVETDCKEECLTTSTGDFYDGTDFDPSGNGSVIPNGVNHHFAQNGIIFDKGDIRPGDYWLGNNVMNFFGQVPFLDQDIAEGVNNYMFCENPSDRIVKLGFPAKDFKNKSYRYKMRLYIQVNHKCDRPIEQAWSQAKFIARTTMGTITQDTLEVMAYDNEGNPLRGSRTPVVNGEFQPVVVGGTDIRVLFSEFLNINSLKTNDVVRVEITFFGRFPNRNDPAVFEFLPMFEQFNCSKVAIDYISAEVENVCLSPNVVCVGDYTTANAAGFPRNSTYEWYKINDGGFWEKLNDISGKGDDFAKVNIKAEKEGKIPYKLIVTANGYRKELEFTIGGRNCDAQPPTAIDGSGVFCLPNSLVYKPNLIDDDPAVTYKWILYDPDNTIVYKSDDKDPHFMPNNDKADQLTISLEENTKEGDYTLAVETYSGTVKQGESVTMPLYVYRTPQISLSLLRNKLDEDANEEISELCASDARREVVAVAENAFNSDAVSLYTYYWSSEPSAPGVLVPRTPANSADVHAELIPGSCSGETKSVALTVRADIKGCSSTATNTYPINAGDEPTIDCESLIGTQDTFNVAPKRDDADIRVPIPSFTSGCDSDPKMIIEITPKRSDVSLPSSVSKIEVYKSEIATSSKLNITLPWGEYDFHYIVVDGCGRPKDCNANISIVVGNPVIDCSKIVDIDVVNGKYNSEGSDKCTVVFNTVDLKAPVLKDFNDIAEKELTGEYQGRRHFSFAEGRQNKEDLMGTAAARALFDKDNFGLYDEYKIDYTYILWSFTNAGKTSYCVQEVLVEDKTLPAFDCDKIESPFRPITEKGKCEIKFEDFWETLKNKNYIAYDSCPELTPIPGELHSDPLEPSKVDGQRVFKVGIEETIYWQFRDKHNNVKTCPQVINAFSGDSVDVNCSALEYFEATAEPGTCFVNSSEVNFPRPPYGTEPCPDENNELIQVPGVGVRNDGKDLDDDYPTGDTYITWTFTGENSFPSTCKTHVFVKGNKHFDLDCDVLFPPVDKIAPECDSTKVKLEPKKVSDPCVVGYMAESVPYLTEYKVNSLDPTKMDTVYTLITDNPHDFGRIGEHFVSWVFWDYTHNISDTCVQSIHLRDNKPPIFRCEDIPDSIGVTLTGACKIPYKDLRSQIGDYYAIEACTGDLIAGVPYLYDPNTDTRSEFPAEVSVGIYPIIWVFANDSLTTAETTCKKTLYVLSDYEPPFDCNTLKDITLVDEVGLCVVPLNPTLLPIPSTHDYCVTDYIVYGHAYIQLHGEGEYVELAYFDRNTNSAVYTMAVPFGKHNVKWIFKSPYSTKEKICTQVVIAKSDALDKFNCEDLASYVIVEYKGDDPIGPSYQEVVLAGLKKPVLDDPCHVLDTLYTRNDGKSIYDRYPVNAITKIEWLVKDTTHSNPQQKKCNTTVEVKNGDIGIPLCPDIAGTFLCENDIPAAYATYQEFLSAGGDVISRGESVKEFINPNSFSMTESIEGDGVCEYFYVRTYHFKDFRDQSAQCSQKIKVKDDQGPIWDKGASATQIFDCKEINFFPTDLQATDACLNTVYSTMNKVNKLESLPEGLFYTVHSTKSDDPRDCNYYSYTETRTYVAVDKCHNSSAELVYKSVVQDTFAPVLSIPQDWYDSTFVANYGVPCIFTVPDITNSLPDGSYTDKCDPSAIQYYKITQSPAPGTIYDPNKGNQYVTLFITDPCGNTSSTKHEIYVPTRKEVVSETMYDRTICAEQELTLASQYISEDHGSIWTYDKWEDRWYWRPTLSVVFDYYRGDVDPKNLIYSNNPKTYGNLFGPLSENESWILNDTTKSGKYSIVVMDTIRFCTDTASSFITIHSKPYIHLDPGAIPVCEYDSIHLISDDEAMFDKYHVEVDSVHEVIIEQGWSVDSIKYDPMTPFVYKPDSMKLHYYAVNVCGGNFSGNYISIGVRERMKPENLMLVTDPQDKPRVLIGENASLQLITKYDPVEYRWMRVKGTVDGLDDEVFDREGNVREEYKRLFDEPDEYLGSTFDYEPGHDKISLYALGDTASYYTLLIDSVCPAVPSNIVSIDVVTQLPTAFTPQNSIGMNDKFVDGHHVIIFNRYGQKMVESDNGWDGTCRGVLVDPGVYFYEVIINEGQRVKGSIEVVYFK